MPVFVVIHEALGAARQAGAARLLDEVQIHLIPVLLGDGVRLFEQAGDGRVELERIGLAQSGQLADLRFRVRDHGAGK